MTPLQALARGAGRGALALGRAAAGVGLTIRTRAGLFASAQRASASIHALQKQVASAQKQIAAHHQRERKLASDLLSAEQVVVEITEAARAHAQDTIEAAQVTANEIIQGARVTANGELAVARAAADDTLRTARAQAQEELTGITQQAAVRLEELQVAADRTIAEASQMVLEMKRTAEAHSAALVEKVTAFEAEREEYARGLKLLVQRHVETLDTVTHLHAGVQQELLPALRRMMAGLKGAEADWLKRQGNKNGEARDHRAVGVAPATPSIPSTPGPDAPSPAGSPRREGVITVRHVTSFKEAAKLVNILSQVPGVQGIRLRSYSGGVATVDVALGGSTLAGFDLKTLDGIPITVIESTDTQLILQVVHAPQRPA
ncbi:MAG TPA: hypothetical protein VJT32_05615 [bacterium]|nr:hypothetical protein [bacterium]